MKRMLINATHNEELRVALVDGQKLYDLDIESRSREQKKANIYKARITRVEPSLEAAFVDYGGNRHGFLPLKEISREYFSVSPDKIKGRVNIKDVVKEGLELVVQIDKEERGNKGAALTSFYSLAGRYLVLMPNNPRAGGISKRIEGEERDELKDAMSKLEIPQDMGVIVRTAGLGRSAKELQWDLNYLLQLDEAIKTASASNKSPFLIYQESDVITRAVRDNLRDDMGEILIDTTEAYDQAVEFVDKVMPQYKSRIKKYDSDVPLFNRYQIEGQIETAFKREVRLPSGGALVIDPTEALISIDINSAKSTRGHDIEETALNTNLEAAEEICRQFRLRDIGGLIVIDFIDMSSTKNQRAVENRMRDSLQVDRARVQVGRISRFGLLEMSRQRLRSSLGETSGIVCPRCDGLGTIRDIESSSLAVIRIVEEEALKETSSEIRAFLPIAVSSFLLNEKRNVLSEIEQRNKVRVVVVPAPEMQTPHYRVERIREADAEEKTVSYELTAEEEAAPPPKPNAPRPNAEKAAVETVIPPAAPAAEVEAKPGLFSRLLTLFQPSEKPAETAPKKARSRNNEPRRQSNNRNRKRNDGGRSREQDANRDNSKKNDGDRSRGQNTNKRDDSKKPDTRRNDSQKNRSERNGNTDTGNNKEGKKTDNSTPKRAERTERPKQDSENQGKSDDKRNQGQRERGNQRRRRKPATDTAENTVEEQEVNQASSTAEPTQASVEPSTDSKAPSAAAQPSVDNNEPPTLTEQLASDKEPSAVADESAGNKEPSAAANEPDGNKSEPSAAADESVSSKEPSKATDDSVSNKEPSAATDESVSNKEPSAATDESVSNKEPSAATDESASNKEQSAESKKPGGRASNDPRLNPKSVKTSQVLEDAPAKVAPEVLSYVGAQIDTAHPSNKGRAANDPRGNAAPSPSAVQEPELAGDEEESAER